MNGGRKEDSIHGKFMHVGSDGTIVLSFSLINSNPRDWVYDWEFQRIDKIFFASVTKALAPIANISVESQVLYHMPKSSFSSWDEILHSYIFRTSDLPFFVNSKEWHLDTSAGAIGRSKILQNIAKVCSDINKPNGQFVLENDRSTVRAFISSLPLRKIGGFGKVTEHILEDVLGIKTCEEIVQKGSLLYALFYQSSADFFLSVGLELGKTDTPERTFAATGDGRLLFSKLAEITEILSDDRAKYSDTQSHEIADRVICSVTYGIVVVSCSSLFNYRSLEEVRFFAQKKNLISIFYGTGTSEIMGLFNCNTSDKECKEAIDGLIKSHEFKLETNETNWSSCVGKTAMILRAKIGKTELVLSWILLVLEQELYQDC